MTSSDFSIIKILGDLRKNLIINCVDRNYSPEEIIEELRKLKLDHSGVGESGIQDTIINGINKRWNEERKEWVDNTQLNLFRSFTEDDERKFWSSYLAKFSPNQAETLLKDMKEILSNVKRITQAAERITRDIDYIVSKVKEYEGDK